MRHKPPHPEFSKALQTRVRNGTEFVQESRVGGTQKCDGFFASFRREVDKRPLNTVGLCPSRYEELMSRRVRMFQFKYWFAGRDPWLVFSHLRQAGRAGAEDLWDALNACCPQAAPAELSEAESELYSGE